MVVLAAKRARQILVGSEVKSEERSTKDVTNALEEILEGKITYTVVYDKNEKEDNYDEGEKAEEGAEKDEATAKGFDEENYDEGEPTIVIDTAANDDLETAEAEEKTEEVPKEAAEEAPAQNEEATETAEETKEETDNTNQSEDAGDKGDEEYNEDVSDVIIDAPKKTAE